MIRVDLFDLIPLTKTSFYPILLQNMDLVGIHHTPHYLVIGLVQLNRCGMGPLLVLVLVFPCFRENVVVTCKIGSFLYSLENLLQKNVIVFLFFFEIKFQNSAHLKKRAIFDLLFTFFSYQGNVTKIPSAHISLTYVHVFCSPY